MPIKDFWMLNRQLPRIRADEGLANIDSYLLGSMGAGEIYKDVRERYIEGIGEYISVVNKPTLEDGFDTLRDIYETLRQGK